MREHAVAGLQGARGQARELGVEDPLQAADADLGVVGHAELAQLRGAVLRRRPERADDEAGDVGQRAGARLAGGELRAVAREERAAPAQVGSSRA